MSLLFFTLTHVRPILHSYGNQSNDLHCRSIDRFLYGGKIKPIWDKDCSHPFFLTQNVTRSATRINNGTSSEPILIQMLVFFH